MEKQINNFLTKDQFYCTLPVHEYSLDYPLQNLYFIVSIRNPRWQPQQYKFSKVPYGKIFNIYS
jgi:hypothetical protein